MTMISVTVDICDPDGGDDYIGFGIMMRRDHPNVTFTILEGSPNLDTDEVTLSGEPDAVLACLNDVFRTGATAPDVPEWTIVDGRVLCLDTDWAVRGTN